MSEYVGMCRNVPKRSKVFQNVPTTNEALNADSIFNHVGIVAKCRNVSEYVGMR